MSTREKELDHTQLILNLFEFSSTAAAVYNIDSGICLTHNRAFITQLGVPGEKIDSGEIKFSDLFNDPQESTGFLDLLTKRSVVRRYEVNLVDNEQRSFQVLASGRILNEEPQRLFEFSFIDFSKQKQLQTALNQEHARIVSLMDNLTAGLFLVDQAGKITEANFALSNILGIGEDDLIGKSDEDLISLLISQSNEPEVLQQTLSTAILNIGEKPSFEIEQVSNGSNYHFEITLFPVRDDEGLPLGWGGLIQDITSLREQTSWKLDLLSMLAKDLRSPLATLKGHATALLGNFQSWGTEMTLEFLESINSSTDNLIHLVDRNLALTRVETGRLGLRPQAIAPENLIEQGLERAAGLLENVPVELEISDDLPDVRVDPARIEEVLINLIENAVVHANTPEGILLGAEATSTHVRFFVQDDGPGISKEMQITIFEKVEQDESEQFAAGMGLFIAKKIVEAHGGNIGLQSPLPGKEHGSQFTFTVPKMIEQPEIHPSGSGRTEPEVSDTALKDVPPHILVVDDQPDFQALYRSLLNENEYEIEFSSEGKSAIEISRVSPPDLILLEWVLPDVEGISVCRQIRRWSDVPIIMVTSRSAQEDMVAALDAGVDDYLVKPFLGDELIARMRAVLRRGEQLKTQRPDQRFSQKGLVIDYDSHEVWRQGKKLELTATEFDLLVYFSKNQRRTLKYQQIISNIWGNSAGGTRHALSVHISRLRKKIEPDPDEPTFIVTRWGVGYVFLP